MFNNHQIQKGPQAPTGGPFSSENGRLLTICRIGTVPSSGAGYVPSKRGVLNARAYTIDGGNVNPDTLAKRLSQGSVVLISSDGQIPSREYAQYLKPSAVVLVIKLPFNSSTPPVTRIRILESQKTSQ